jgi:hypothetical protein
MNEDDRQELQEDDQVGQVSQAAKMFLPRQTFPNRVSLQFVTLRLFLEKLRTSSGVELLLA